MQIIGARRRWAIWIGLAGKPQIGVAKIVNNKESVLDGRCPEGASASPLNVALPAILHRLVLVFEMFDGHGGVHVEDGFADGVPLAAMGKKDGRQPGRRAESHTRSSAAGSWSHIIAAVCVPSNNQLSRKGDGPLWSVISITEGPFFGRPG